ncbi:MAG: hypothetical protein JSW06_00720 [Thermoplasmatales archaeon]|nr:MAG: hypothetical protein JSW06_00720 [Thermoplasmatales archaeon]
MKHVIPILVVLLLLSSGFVGVSVIPSIGTVEQEYRPLDIGCSSVELYNGRNGWNHTFGGVSYDEGYSVQQTSDSGYIITGATLSFGAGNWDVWLIKTDSSGSEQWNRTFGGSSYDRGSSVQQTSDDGYIIAGATYSYGLGDFDVWLIKTDSVGNEEWNYTFGGSSDDRGYSGQQTSDDGYIISGYTDSYGAGDSDVWLIKTDSNGIEVWNSTFGGINYDRGFSVQQTSDGGYIITGYTVSYDTDDTGCDIWLIKTDSNGIEEWHQTFGGTGVSNKFDMGYSVQQTSDGGFIITGDTEIYFVAKSDVWLIKTDSVGNEEWNHTFGGSGTDRGRSVQQTSDRGYIITGWAWSFSVVDPDIWLIKTDSSGNEEWNYTYLYGENSGDWGYSCQQTNDGGYIIAGAIASYIGEGTDVWLIKIAGENHLPNPPIITGPINGKIWVLYEYNFSLSDPDGDNISFRVDWGIGGPSKLHGPFASGTIVPLNYSWRRRGTYIIRAQAIDVYGAESDWGYLEVTMPMNQQTTFSSWWFMRFLQSHPRMFPILRQLLGWYT